MSAMVLDLKAAWQKILACQMVGLTCWTEALALHNCDLDEVLAKMKSAMRRCSLIAHSFHIRFTLVVRPFAEVFSNSVGKPLLLPKPTSEVRA